VDIGKFHLGEICGEGFSATN